MAKAERQALSIGAEFASFKVTGVFKITSRVELYFVDLRLDENQVERCVARVYVQGDDNIQKLNEREVFAVENLSSCTGIMRRLGAWNVDSCKVFVSRYCSLGNLDMYCSQQRGQSITKGDWHFIMWQILDTLSDLHEQHWVHGNLSISNVWLDECSEGRGPRVVLAGLEHAYRISEDAYVREDKYSPPEAIRGDPCGYAADMWAVGVMMYQVMNGRGADPFPFHDIEEFKRSVLSGCYDMRILDEKLAENGRDLIYRLLTVDPDCRITADQAMKHPWITESGSLHCVLQEADDWAS